MLNGLVEAHMSKKNHEGKPTSRMTSCSESLPRFPSRDEFFGSLPRGRKNDKRTMNITLDAAWASTNDPSDKPKKKDP